MVNLHGRTAKNNKHFFNFYSRRYSSLMHQIIPVDEAVFIIVYLIDNFFAILYSDFLPPVSINGVFIQFQWGEGVIFVQCSGIQIQLSKR